MLTLVPSETSLTVALAGHGVTAAITVSAVACFCAVSPPVACITCCERHTTFDPERERERMRHLQLKPAEVMVSLVHRYLSCSCAQSSRERRNTGRSPRHSERCSRRYTSPDTPVQSVRSDTLWDDRRKGTGFWKPVFWETSSNNFVMILIPKPALANLHSSPQIRLSQLGHCLTRYHGNQAAHCTDTYCSDTISP